MGIRYRKKAPDPANTSATTKASEAEKAKRRGGRPRKEVQAQRPPDARGAANSKEVFRPTNHDKDDDKEGQDNKVPVADALHAALRNEVRLALTLAFTMKSANSEGDSAVYPCSMCPFKCFKQVDTLEAHIKNAHNHKNGYVCSGSKQRRLVHALYDSDMLSGCEDSFSLLSRSAEIMRSIVSPPLPPDINDINRFLRLVLTERGPEYHNAKTIATTTAVRRVGNTYYTLGFANMLFREVMMCKGRLKEALQRLRLQLGLAGCKVVNALPSNADLTWHLIQDVISTEPIQAMRTQMLAQLEENNEFETVNIDCTVKIAMSVIGQTPHPSSTASAAFAEDEHYRKVMTFVGSTGCPLALRMVREESADAMCSELQRVCSRRTSLPESGMWELTTPRLFNTRGSKRYFPICTSFSWTRRTWS